LPAAAKRAADVLSAAEGVEGVSDIFDAFLERKEGPRLLAAALAGRARGLSPGLPADVAKVGVRAARTSARDTSGLVEALAGAGGLTFGPRSLTPGEMRQMVADVARHGDPARG